MKFTKLEAWSLRRLHCNLVSSGSSCFLHPVRNVPEKSILCAVGENRKRSTFVPSLVSRMWTSGVYVLILAVPLF